jgi:hypothetical protein
MKASRNWPEFVGLIDRALPKRSLDELEPPAAEE